MTIGAKLFYLTFWILLVCSFVKFTNNEERLREDSKKSWLLKVCGVSTACWVVLSYIFILPRLYTSPLLLLSATLLFIYYLYNTKMVYIVFFLAGLVMNHLTIVLNGGFMPLHKEALVRLDGILSPIALNGELIKYVGYEYMSEDTILPFLSDWIYFPYLGSVISPGDILICLSFIIFLMIKIKR